MPTRIEWCDETLNPLGQWCYGPGGTQSKPNRCTYCYAKTMASRGMQSCPQCKAFEKHHHLERLEQLKEWKRPRNIFMQSMGDLFHNEVPDKWIQAVFDACEAAPQHNYLFLTKNPAGIEKAIDNYACEDRGCEDCYEFFDNFWFGTTVTNQADITRADVLSEIEEGHRFLSIEPISGPISLDFKMSRCPKCGSKEIYEDNPMTTPKGVMPVYCDCCGEWESNSINNAVPDIGWVIIGAETGNRWDKIIPKLEWVAEIVNQCRAAGVPVFMKNSLADVWGEPLIQEYPPELQPRPAPRPKRRVHAKCIHDPVCCDECGTPLQGKPAFRLGARRYECMTCYEKLEAK